jgi:fucose permease
MNSRNMFRVVLIMVIFFVISLLTNIIGPLVPDIIKSFELNLTMAAFLPFSFFAAYGVMSIPSGVIIEKWGEKPVLLGSFAFALAGSLLFSFAPSYPTALLSLFMIGLGMAALQVAINPLLRVSGGEDHFAFNSVLAQIVFGAASFVSPLIYSHFALNLHKDGGDPLIQALSSVVPKNLPWISMYWVFSVVTVAMIGVIAMVRIPRVERKDDEKTGAMEVHRKLLGMPVVWLYFIGIFAYVGIEQGLANWMSEYLKSQHGFNPQVDGANAVSRFWLLITVGCVLGLVLLKFVDSKKVLFGFSLSSLFVLTAAIFGSKEVAIVAFPLMGFSISVMWSIVFSLALNSLPTSHGTFSGILCTGIIGGAVVPLLVGGLGDYVGLKWGLCFIYLPLLYILSMGVWASPLVKNKTVFDEQKT